MTLPSITIPPTFRVFDFKTKLYMYVFAYFLQEAKKREEEERERKQQEEMARLEKEEAERKAREEAERLVEKNGMNTYGFKGMKN